MQPSGAAFDAGIETWVAEQRTPWARLKYAVTASNLRRHLGDGPLDLDAGGGNGADSARTVLKGPGSSDALPGYPPAWQEPERRQDEPVT